MEEKKILNEEELSRIAGGDQKEDEERRRKEIEMRGHLSIDAAGNYVFMDKHGTTGVFTPEILFDFFQKSIDFPKKCSYNHLRTIVRN